MKVAIIGASGYTGAELLRLLHGHKQAEILFLTSQTNLDLSIASIYPHLLSIYENKFVAIKDVLDHAADVDVIFTALPHGHAMEIGKALSKFQTKLIDLGADYRFSDSDVYEKWYKVKHTHPNSGAVFGLCDIYKEQIKSAKIVANPGCYPTASILALHPLLKADLIETDSIIIDASSGTTGAGRGLKLSSHFSEVFENFTAYGVASHRHTPEIETYLSKSSGNQVTLTFTPHLLPIARGILATSYAKLKSGVSSEEIKKAYTLYKDRQFIRVLGNVSPSTKNVRGSNYIDIGWFIDSRTNTIIVLSAIDNLIKGASGQAIQNMNIMFDLEENTGLDFVPIYP
jgi:N-acetyl-gamma-glutamyl-phosphate reductase